MKTTWYMLVALTIVAMLAVVPAHAASVSLSDADLAVISGKAMNASDGTSFATLDEGNANSQTGSYSWGDGHTNDASNHKGANDVSGATSAVQQNVTSTSNVINWGAASNGHAIVGTVGTDLNQSGAGSATQHIGGF